MVWCRVAVLVLAVLGTLFGVLTNTLPVFRGERTMGTEFTTLWYGRLKVDHSIIRVSTEGCKTFVRYFFASEAFAVIATLGGVAIVVLAIMQILVSQRRGFVVYSVSILSFIAFLACVICVGLLAHVYVADLCQDESHPLRDHYTSLKSQGLRYAEAFGFICAACGVFMVGAVVQCFGVSVANSISSDDKGGLYADTRV
ncbi:hypothetical protein DQ04_09851020 [Trypanosoma grayi]|uniref:hypothetical protein n=1 Tax=Trypanosoma grayi TaxID=71804 RepID=UPI0004F487BA|nr:hypothetical protein DQ04_09851020 [Trypanosoma grayi]KEG07425.1 hypothetical protein DQ04_09851020 [Trypanosoma grayi]